MSLSLASSPTIIPRFLFSAPIKELGTAPYRPEKEKKKESQKTFRYPMLSTSEREVSFEHFPCKNKLKLHG